MRFNPDVPPKHEEIINKAREEDRMRRYQSAKEILVDLQRLRRNLVSGKQVAAGPTLDPRAYDAWLRARHEGLAFTKEGIDRALQLTNQALAIVADKARERALANPHQAAAARKLKAGKGGGFVRVEVQNLIHMGHLQNL